MLSMSITLCTLFAACQTPFSHNQKKEFIEKEISTNTMSTDTSIEQVNTPIAIKTEADFNTAVLQATRPVVVTFSAKWCGACKELKPILASIQEKMPEYLFFSIDIDQAPWAIEKFGIRGVPVSLLFKNGVELTSQETRSVGSKSEAVFKKFINSYFTQHTT